MSQQLMFDIVLGVEASQHLDVNALKLNVNEFAAKITKQEDYEKIRDKLRATCVTQATAPQELSAAAPQPAGAPS
jgi:hypothetical protein